MKSKEHPDSVLGIAFWTAAFVPVLAVFLGLLVTPPERYIGELEGMFIPVGVYGFTGFLGALPSFLVGLLLLFPLRLGSFTFRSRLLIFRAICAGISVVAVCFGLILILHHEHQIEF